MENKKGNGLVVFLVTVLIGVTTIGILLFTGVIKSPFVKYDKEVVDNKTTESTTYKAYNIGDEITFNNEKWHVIKNSTISDDYVTLLKDTDIVELKQQPYYKCPPEDDNGINCNMKMSNDYQKSVAKKYFDDTYINALGITNLKEVDGYSVRLITIDELSSLGCDVNNLTCSGAPSWVTSNVVSWTMSYTTTAPTDDARYANVYSYGVAEGFSGNGLNINGVGSTLSVRPVINLLKSSIK